MGTQTPPEISIRTYANGDEEAILKLERIVYGVHQHLNAKTWTWKYRENPFGSVIGIAECNGQVVGSMSLIIADIKIGDKIARSAQPADLFVHPNFRRRGIYSSLYKFVINEAEKAKVEVFFGFPTKEAYFGSLKYGFFHVAKIQKMTKCMDTGYVFKELALSIFSKPLDHTKFFQLKDISKNFLKALLVSMISFIGHLAHAHSVLKGASYENLNFRLLESFDNSIEDFWKDVSKEYSMIVPREHDYMLWRIFKEPFSKYRVFVAEKNGKILGFIVVSHKEEDKIRLGHIVDFIVSPKQKEVMRFLLQEAVKYLRGKNVNIIESYVPKTSAWHRVFLGSFFASLSSVELNARVNSARVRKDLFENYKEWHLTMIDRL